MQSSYCGLITLVGRPNVGKSTLLNALVGKKLSITSHKPQTTRLNLYGIETLGDRQAVYIDTPGLNREADRALNRRMNQQAKSTLEDVDVVVMVVEVGRWTPGDDHVLSLLNPNQTVILAVNKVDTFQDKTKMLPFLQKVSAMYPFKEIVPLSAFCQDNVTKLKDMVLTMLPENPFYFPEDMTCSHPKTYQMSEMVREKIMRQLEEELPYSASVQIEHQEDKGHYQEIHALIWVEREGQKKIMIGAKGQTLKTIGMHARRDIERLLGKKVLLKLWVKVKKGWADDPKALAQLGFEA